MSFVVKWSIEVMKLAWSYFFLLRSFRLGPARSATSLVRLRFAGFGVARFCFDLVDFVLVIFDGAVILFSAV